jgi:hypothetical protein
LSDTHANAKVPETDNIKVKSVKVNAVLSQAKAGA